MKAKEAAVEQRELPGMTPVKIKKIRDAIKVYRHACEVRTQARKDVVAAKGKVRDTMKDEEIPIYSYEGQRYALKQGDLEVQITKERKKDKKAGDETEAAE